MTLWVLEPVTQLPDGDDPWEPWYDKCFGFVICADTEARARAIADENACDENDGDSFQSLAGAEILHLSTA